MSQPTGDPDRTLFISYRVADTGPTASRLFKELADAYGRECVFLDHQRLEGGAPWPERLEEAARQASVMLVLIGEGWLRAQDSKSYMRRLDQPGDWVRKEIEVALGADVLVVPLLVEEAEPLSLDALEAVPSLVPLAERQALALRRKEWQSDLGRLQALLDERGFVRRGGEVTSIPPEQLEALVRDRTKPLQELADTQKLAIGLLQDRLQLNERQMRAALKAAGEAEVPPEQIAARLVEIAGRYKALQEEVRPEPGDDSRVAGLKAQAAEAIERGELEQADTILAELGKAQEAIFDAQKASFEQAALDMAETQAQRGDIALARLRYSEAAGHFARAAGLVLAWHEEARATYLERQADVLYWQGEERGDNTALIEAITLHRDLLVARTRERVPLDWAMTQNNLGTALASLGERMERTDFLVEALGAIREAHLICMQASMNQYEGYFVARIEEIEAKIATLQGG